ncbi:MAG: hypothetical protein CUR34_07660 [Sediminibacterium sp.]|nr:MAG: hypothetical protein CUR34_07660 [Sediminibacterium sp.] [Sediminibacterium sp. FEMGT703S]
MIINSLSTTETLPEIFQEVQTITLEQLDIAGQVILHCRHYGCNAECGKSIRCEIKLNPGIALVPVDGGNPSTILNRMGLVERDGLFVISSDLLQMYISSL